MQGYQGTLQTDGYNVYKHYYADKKVTHLACWAHARRKFEKALENDRKRAEHAMTQIQKLYAIEREAKDLTPQGRKELRLEKALPIINDLVNGCTASTSWFYPSHPLAGR
ncbi:MAG: transposase [Bacteroidales bacterium]|nr:transposase [Bacteroidales bacterium]